MGKNLEKIFDNITDLQLLESKAMELEETSYEFKQTSGKVKRRTVCKNWVLCCIILFLVCVVLLVSIIATGFGTFLLLEIFYFNK